MATTVESIIDQLRSLIGDEDSSNYRYTLANLRDIKIPLGLQRLNSLGWGQIYEVSGSGASATFNPNPNDVTPSDLQAILLATALVVTEGELSKYSNAAYSITNPAGRTDFTRIPEALQQRVKSIEAALEALRLARGKADAESKASTTELTGQTTTQGPEGLPIITITKTV